MCEHSIANPFPDIEDSIVSGVEKAINIVLKLFNSLMGEFHIISNQAGVYLNINEFSISTQISMIDETNFSLIVQR